MTKQNSKLNFLKQAVDEVVGRSDRLMDEIEKLEAVAIKSNDGLAKITLLEHDLICGKIEASRGRWRLAAYILLSLLAVSFSANIFAIII